jgi:hypothetical protein
VTVIVCGVVMQSVLVWPSSNDSLASKFVVLGLRLLCAAVCLALTFVGIDSISDSAWLGLLVSIMSLTCLMEYTLR